MIEPEKKQDPLAALRLRGRIERERRVDGAEEAARKALAGARRALGELTHRCGDVEEAKVLLAEAESGLAHMSDGEQRGKLEARLAGIRKSIEESERVCKFVRR
ncbi:MAG: hypothetical protein HY293_19370 [Planctomycetes bacterium]|nr:hypothetical protein [Planctomycetota bacterium]